MAFDQTTRNRLQSFVSKARAILSEEFTRQLQATYGLDPKQGTIADIGSLSYLDNYQLQTAHILRETVQHYMSTTGGKTQKEQVKLVLERIVREQAFTVLNRLAALRMAEARGFLLESIGSGYSSQGFQLYQMLEDGSHGETGDAYQSYLFSLFDEFGLDLAVLFDRFSVQGRLFPRETALLQLLEQINDYEIEPLWAKDETIGWIYQYFNSQEERKKMRSESSAPRNSRELAVRNQFFTPRYVVEFLTDNTLGRIWYEMTKGNTALVDSCQYLVKRPNEVFLSQGENSPIQNESSLDENLEALTQEEILSQPVYILHRPLKDPRTIKMLDPACGSMHFGLYAFDLFEHIYLEAWQIEAEQGADVFELEADLVSLHSTFEDIESFKQQIPKLIIEYNIHGVDIDPRAVQIAGLSLWQRAQRAWHEQGIKPSQRPTIVKSNIVCAEPMPGEQDLLKEFTSTLNPPALGQLVEVIFEKMALAGEAGTLLKIEQEIQSAIDEARNQWQDKKGSNHRIDDLFEEELLAANPQQELGFDLSGINDETFWEDAEQLILQALQNYSEQATSAAGEKRLFAEDAAKGFAFIDLSRKRFDVVLMNPPFGDPSISIKKYLSSMYRGQPNDLYSCFIERSIETQCIGLSGYVTPREFITYSSFKDLRKSIIYPNVSFSVFVDCGLGVMDEAMVRAAFYVLDHSRALGKKPYIRLIDEPKKSSTTAQIVNSINNNSVKDKRVYFADQEDFSGVGEAALAYWIPEETVKRFSGKLFSDIAGDAKLGVQTANNFQFLRLTSELNSNMGKSGAWRPYIKGGSFQKYYNNIHMQILWKNQGQHIVDSYGSSVRLRDVSQYESYGLNYPLINEIGINVGILPKKAIFDNGSPSIFPFNYDDIFLILGLVNSRFVELCFRCLTSTRHWQVGYLRAIPWVNVDEVVFKKISRLAKEAADLQYLIVSEDELSIDFKIPKVVEKIRDYGVEKGLIEAAWNEVLLYQKLINIDFEIDILSCEAFSISSREYEVLLNIVGMHPCEINTLTIEASDVYRHHRVSLSEYENYLWKNKVSSKKNVKTIGFDIDIKVEARKFISFVFGDLFDRWNESSTLANESLFSEKVIINKGIFSTQKIYSCDVATDNNIVKSFINSVNIIFDTINGQQTIDYISKVLSVSIEDYLSNSNYFFSYHLTSYTKSQRQAPVYWPLQTKSGSYTLWVYYHRLNTQTLYSCVNDFVEPKLTLVNEDLNALNNKSNRSRIEEKELAQLTDLQNELKDFRDELLRLAKVWKPNLNDGVQITAAPLWKLFQHTAWQKKLKETWEKLEEGEYDWAHLAASIWPDRVLRKCHQDRSLAIAHDVEDMFWQEVEEPVMRGKKPTGKTKLEWQPIPTSETTLNDMVNEAKARLQ